MCSSCVVDLYIPPHIFIIQDQVECSLLCQFPEATCSPYDIENGTFAQRSYKDGEDAIIECLEGYEITPSLPVCIGGVWNIDNANCVDINECDNNQHNCDPDATCKNLEGGYICECPDGKELYNDQKDVEGRYLIPNVSCIWTSCAFDDLTKDESWIVWNKKDYYRNNESVTFLCNMTYLKDETYASFTARCLNGQWENARNPCNGAYSSVVSIN
ncbi:unnamed protein product, partial [Cylicostephanus goldi]